MKFSIDSDQRKAIQIMSGLGGMMASGGNLVAMGIGAAVAVEAVTEEPVLDLINLAKEPIRRLVGKISHRSIL